MSGIGSNFNIKPNIQTSNVSKTESSKNAPQTDKPNNQSKILKQTSKSAPKSVTQMMSGTLANSMVNKNINLGRVNELTKLQSALRAEKLDEAQEDSESTMLQNASKLIGSKKGAKETGKQTNQKEILRQSQQKLAKNVDSMLDKMDDKMAQENLKSGAKSASKNLQSGSNKQDIQKKFLASAQSLAENIDDLQDIMSDEMEDLKDDIMAFKGLSKSDKKDLNKDSLKGLSEKFKLLLKNPEISQEAAEKIDEILDNMEDLMVELQEDSGELAVSQKVGKDKGATGVKNKNEVLTSFKFKIEQLSESDSSIDNIESTIEKIDTFFNSENFTGLDVDLQQSILGFIDGNSTKISSSFDEIGEIDDQSLSLSELIPNGSIGKKEISSSLSMSNPISIEAPLIDRSDSKSGKVNLNGFYLSLLPIKNPDKVKELIPRLKV